MTRPYVLERYRDAAGDYRWRLKAPNGRVRAEGGEGYKRPGQMNRAIEDLRRAFPSAIVRDV